MTSDRIPALALDNYQRAARVILSNHLVTQTYPDRIALPLLRRWATELREDLLDLFGYRLEVTETTARLFPIIDRLDPTQPARTATERIFDRRRYAYLTLALAALGRAGDQITLSELADHVAAETAQVDGLDLATERATDRDAFVDAVGWLATRGAITLADGDAGGWASDPSAGEALYDIDRTVVLALFRPPRALQQLHSISGLLSGASIGLDELSDDSTPDPLETARRTRRALVERPVVYFAELAAAEAGLLVSNRLVAEVEGLTGLSAERRAEGVALIDTSGRFSDIRFPSTGTLAQVGLLLAGELADRVLDPDHPPRLIGTPPDPSVALAHQLDTAIPDSALIETAGVHAVPIEPDAGADLPFVEDSWVAATIEGLIERYGKTFAAQWQADHVGLLAGAVALLARLRLVVVVEGGLLALPALARYRGVVVNVRTHPEQSLYTTPIESEHP
ncbi:TIGR02678 family protein [Antrihabitans sp. YC3-6]|uniref:TIGR02678 family protein n=1 Tax=Antrihabitans stalagmiti TaxID=2799499 RepID=A0A934NLX8_9NOCA|nr:TIGR02678 family protein [Antrihabitans stalagmiti]MBJ8337600.1 TIGR02678 family protein [Antrihabitans stalagmiti]